MRFFIILENRKVSAASPRSIRGPIRRVDRGGKGKRAHSAPQSAQSGSISRIFIAVYEVHERVTTNLASLCDDESRALVHIFM